MKIYTPFQTDELANILKNDGVISVPTDTVFGVCARIASIEARNNLMKVKNRPMDKLFPIMCADIEQIKTISNVDENAEILINEFMPGPITLVLPKKAGLPEYINNGKETIAIRMATSEPIRELIQKTGSPIFMSSANQSGQPTCTSLAEIEKACPNLDGMMDGSVSYGKSSTIVYCVNGIVKILRLGPISSSQVFKALEKGV